MPVSSDRELVDAVVFASRALVAIAARSLAAAPEDISLPQYRALVVLVSRGPQRVGDLAAELDVAPSTITRLCDRLVRKGFVRRGVHDANRREVTIEATPAGRSIVDVVTAARRREIATVIKRIPATRRRQLVRSLEDLGTAAGELPEAVWSLGWGP